MSSQQGPSISAAFEQKVRSGALAAEIAEAVAATWCLVERSLSPIIGRQGVAALYKRSILLTGRSHPWLATLYEGASESVDLPALTAVLTQQESIAAALSGGELLATFYALVSSLIGPSLTRRLLPFIWQTNE